ncbi:hypothetical protein PV416_13840 [Streptomyces ipomoeae]|uniref:hypothetical protein n=1 Tax=Streptomyces ipomoeae TaxID=103232 RepID=UPI0029B9DACA|nr:hypothetical protein [Streptomyces ipomoeae]MDX2822150.1 hypothetical protein [Streptomyces ipomoeae]MDX2874503.1 hypothetical protein [Streptomyces ipomoeae]
MFFRRAREDRAFREAQRAGYELLLRLQATQPWTDCPEPTPQDPVAEEAAVPDFLPPELRLPSRQEVAGVMMRWLQPLVVDGEVRTCPGCGVYRDWIVFCMRDDSMWLRCRAGHETKEPSLDAVWFNRHSGPVDRFHPTLEEGLRDLGH